jgi:hypothetical protein
MKRISKYVFLKIEILFMPLLSTGKQPAVVSFQEGTASSPFLERKGGLQTTHQETKYALSTQHKIPIG